MEILMVVALFFTLSGIYTLANRVTTDRKKNT